MIETNILNQLVFDAFTGKTTWLKASEQFPLEEYIDAFFRTRATMQKTVEGMTDKQVAFNADIVPTWSLSETVTHLIYSQNFYYNQLLDVSSSQLPHIIEAAKGFGEGAQRERPAAELVEALKKATEVIRDGIEKTKKDFDPKHITHFAPFGDCNYATWILLMLGHEIDHVRQAIVMRRLAKQTIRD